SNFWSPSCCSISGCSRTLLKKSGDRQPATGSRRLPHPDVSGVAAAVEPGAGPSTLDLALSSSRPLGTNAAGSRHPTAGTPACPLRLSAHPRPLAAARLADQPQRRASAVAATG